MAPAMSGRSASHEAELAALPPTVSWSSGRPHRHSRLYRVPAEWWGRITGGKELDLEGASKFELRAHGQQAVMVGKHPNDKITGAPGEPCQKVDPVRVMVRASMTG